MSNNARFRENAEKEYEIHVSHYDLKKKKSLFDEVSCDIHDLSVLRDEGIIK